MTDLEEALALLAAPCTDERFFQRALKALALVTQCRWAAFGRPSANEGMAEVIAFCDLKQSIPGFEFNLEGSPCEIIYQMRYPDTHLIYPNDLQQRFPNFQLIKDLGAVSYQAELILDNDGFPIGHILVMDPLPQSESTKSREFFRLLAQRIGIEYKRLLIARELAVHKQMIASTRQLMSFVDSNYRYQVVSKGYETLFDCSANDIIGKHVRELHGEEVFTHHLKPLLDASLSGQSVHTQTLIHPPHLDEPLHLNVHHNPYIDEQGLVLGSIVSAHNITEIQKAKQQTEYLAFHDALTSLPNRLALFQRISSLINTPQTTKALAIIYLDLDNFKEINDSYDHLAGDEVLQQVANVLNRMCDTSEIVARIGGDEFIIVHNFAHQDIESRDQRLLQFCDTLNHQLNEQVSLNGSSLRLTASMGYYWIPPDERDISALICQADKSMYSNKRKKQLNESTQSLFRRQNHVK
ncbi:hypothetical protein TUM4644_16980 [Shewanella colwelliana]|uniref:sensor domain-containing diguanylate cyclase n=1 Tax=Shewanella colwelliana TaxID=23 RepID=UPI001BC53631|nr:sensor domain-containing diguanylate cyclase [Shewanella colwelliana]GIU23458.1 hypothetical protein TUM4644_16980 [Shewanella colwelliana]